MQLAAVNNEAAAQVYWREVNERLPSVFAGIRPIFDERRGRPVASGSAPAGSVRSGCAAG
ncbi:MAG: hypothetical protein R3F54_27030 [Alphaproteobacteria bacterium]